MQETRSTHYIAREDVESLSLSLSQNDRVSFATMTPRVSYSVFDVLMQRCPMEDAMVREIEYDTTLGTTLKNARKRAGYTQERVANAVGILRSTLVSIEQGKRHVRADELLRFSHVFACDVQTLLHDAGICKIELQPGDSVRNVNPRSVHYNRVGTFLRYWSDKYYFHRGRGCDVRYDGITDLYDRSETAQSVCDLELVRRVIV